MILTYHANTVVKYSKKLNIQSAFTRMTSEIEIIFGIANHVELVFRESTV